MLALGSACAAVPWPSGFARTAALAPIELDGAELLDLRGVVHVHTHVSHDSPAGIGELVDAARGAGLAWVALTEHTKPARLPPARGRVDGVLLIPGYEVHIEGGSILALGIDRPPSREGGVAALIRSIRAAGGVALVGHLERSRLADPRRYREAMPDGIELVNLHARAREGWLRLVLRELVLPAPWALRALLRPAEGSLQRWAALPEARAVVGGVDAHAKFRVLGPVGGTLDRYRDMFRLVTTHVLAREASESAVLEALREARSYVAFEGWRPVEAFRFEQLGAAFSVRADAAARLALVCDGTEVDSQRGSSALLSPPEGARLCHAEAWLGDRLWVVTSALEPGAPFPAEPPEAPTRPPAPGKAE